MAGLVSKGCIVVVVVLFYRRGHLGFIHVLG